MGSRGEQRLVGDSGLAPKYLSLCCCLLFKFNVAIYTSVHLRRFKKRMTTGTFSGKERNCLENYPEGTVLRKILLMSFVGQGGPFWCGFVFSVL